MCNHNKHTQFDSNCIDCLDRVFDDSKPIEIKFSIVNIHNVVTDFILTDGTWGNGNLTIESLLESGKIISYSIDI